jgi:hypothetical protein
MARYCRLAPSYSCCECAPWRFVGVDEDGRLECDFVAWIKHLLRLVEGVSHKFNALLLRQIFDRGLVTQFSPKRPGEESVTVVGSTPPGWNGIHDAHARDRAGLFAPVQRHLAYKSRVRPAGYKGKIALWTRSYSGRRVACGQRGPERVKSKVKLERQHLQISMIKCWWILCV